MLKDHKNTVRFMFYAVTITEIVKYISNKRFKLITSGILLCFILYDLTGGFKKIWNGEYCEDKGEIINQAQKVIETVETILR